MLNTFLLTVINILYCGQRRNQVQESKTIVGVCFRKSTVPGFAGSGSVVLVRTETQEIRRVKHEARGVIIAWRGPWAAKVQVFVKGARVPACARWGQALDVLSLLNAIDYQPQEMREGPPSQDRAKQSPNQNLLRVLCLLATSWSLLGGKRSRPSFFSRSSETRRVGSGHR